jgi:hypothetical protein
MSSTHGGRLANFRHPRYGWCRLGMGVEGPPRASRSTMSENACISSFRLPRRPSRNSDVPLEMDRHIQMNRSQGLGETETLGKSPAKRTSVFGPVFDALGTEPQVEGLVLETKIGEVRDARSDRRVGSHSRYSRSQRRPLGTCHGSTANLRTRPRRRASQAESESSSPRSSEPIHAPSGGGGIVLLKYCPPVCGSSRMRACQLLPSLSENRSRHFQLSQMSPVRSGLVADHRFLQDPRVGLADARHIVLGRPLPAPSPQVRLQGRIAQDAQHARRKRLLVSIGHQ